MIDHIPAEMMLSLVLDGLPTRVFWKDRESRILGCNLAFARDVGFDHPSELVGKTNFDYAPPERARAFRADDLEVMATGKARLGIEKSIQLASGETMWIETSKLPLRNSAGEVIGILVTYSDITARRRARDERARLTEELIIARDVAIEANSAKSLFVANMSHELRTPLHAIIGYSEILLEEAVEQSAVRDLKQIRSAGKHLLGMVNDILDMSRVGAGKFVAHEDVVAPTVIVGEVMDALAFMAGASETQLRWASPPPALWTVCDATKLRQCVYNLVSNACKFTRRGLVEVSVAMDADGKHFEIVVADTGIGISGEQIERLFQPFSQADPSITRVYGGTGLGLSITRALAQLMGGEVCVHSVLGQGSTFTLSLPLHEVAGKHSYPVEQVA